MNKPMSERKRPFAIGNLCTAPSSRRIALCRFTSSLQRSTADNRSSSSASYRRLRPGHHRQHG